jgi:hypothetical protein
MVLLSLHYPKGHSPVKFGGWKTAAALAVAAQGLDHGVSNPASNLAPLQAESLPYEGAMSGNPE